MSKKIVVSLLFILFCVNEASAARWVFHWPWEQVYRPRVHHRPHVKRSSSIKTEPKMDRAPKPSCEKVNDAVRVLDPERLALVLKDSTPRQRKIIKNCMGEN